MILADIPPIQITVELASAAAAAGAFGGAVGTALTFTVNKILSYLSNESKLRDARDEKFIAIIEKNVEAMTKMANAVQLLDSLNSHGNIQKT